MALLYMYGREEGRSTAQNGGSRPRAVGVFWSADKLGAAARTGHSVVMKQTYVYEAFAANADGGGVAVSLGLDRFVDWHHYSFTVQQIH